MFDVCRPHLCHGQRLQGYEFCIKHILEDKTAPYRPCAYTAESQSGVSLDIMMLGVLGNIPFLSQ